MFGAGVGWSSRTVFTVIDYSQSVSAGGEQENGPGARHLNVTLPAHVFSVAPAAGHTDVTVHLLNARV